MNLPQNQEHKVRVAAKTALATGVVELELASEDGSDLPVWEPGAHVDLILPSGTVRQYSLCGDPGYLSAYKVAVLLDEKGRGGSREVHEGLETGTVVTIRGPRNHFPLGEHESYLFIAGGIGITPMLAMARKVAAEGRNWRLIYGGRSLDTMAYLPEIKALKGGKVELVPADTKGIPDIKGAIENATGAHVYTCGPEPMLRVVEENTKALLGADFFHFERFGADPNAVPEDTDGDTAFEVELATTGKTLTVAADQKLIDVVRKVVPSVPFSCEQGYCGSCETGVLAGIPLHRDQLLTEDERACNDTMMICVGRSRSPKLVLDI
ncbi:oxidoreductase [Arthrobacter globiformis NBRC 12137]|uniref:Oxidoreductase n=1 Tax=Arthrobacter globiformis (strain ATCC 8010 / DSM 20124 / JCM 1332 / NBRC 12137 / NCIMB 8907 / NRRL B-2979 / 168) TaxID=1077972 RepID=H0QK49_ARTG1|nr:PDR/VanB family oxidoreductase [Arthrobacter globiformis]GAB13289.1 oxidoreductase [Arthrobacter globiformis NBRC 12137]